MIAERHLADVTAKITQLQALSTELSRMTAECTGGRVSACKVIEVLHDHGLCAQGQMVEPRRQRQPDAGPGRSKAKAANARACLRADFGD